MASVLSRQDTNDFTCPSNKRARTTQQTPPTTIPADRLDGLKDLSWRCNAANTAPVLTDPLANALMQGGVSTNYEDRLQIPELRLLSKAFYIAFHNRTTSHIELAVTKESDLLSFPRLELVTHLKWSARTSLFAENVHRFKSLRSLHILEGGAAGQPTIVLPSTLKELFLKVETTSTTYTLPEGLEILYAPFQCPLSSDKFPASLRHLAVEALQPCMTLPENLESLQVGIASNLPKIPPSVRNLLFTGSGPYTLHPEQVTLTLDHSLTTRFVTNSLRGYQPGMMKLREGCGAIGRSRNIHMAF